MRTLALLLVCASGCSFAFANHRATTAQARADCPSYAVPVADTVVAALAIADTVRVAQQASTGPLDIPGLQGTTIGIGVLASIVFAASAASGFAAVHDCRSLVDDHAVRAQ
jgi:presenilin-like A22 family membrane protease